MTGEEFEEARNHRMDVRYSSGVELFPEKMNQFLDALNKVCHCVKIKMQIIFDVAYLDLFETRNCKRVTEIVG